MTAPAIKIQNLDKVYSNGFVALRDINLEIGQGEIFALLGPNGAGKTTLISSICGLVQSDNGSISVKGWDIRQQYKQARSCVGLVPQELHLESFETVINTVRFSRGLFGCAPDEEYIRQLLQDLSLYDKRDNQIRMLSGGMKRRLLIAKALSHQPGILFLDEPTAGVDVALRKSMWQQIEHLRANGVTIILTTHYIEEAESMADRVGVINNGRLILVEQKHSLMQKLGKHTLQITLASPLVEVPSELMELAAKCSQDRRILTISYSPGQQPQAVQNIVQCIHQLQLPITDISSRRSSLEEIVVSLLQEKSK